MGSVTVSPAEVPINGITTDEENLWISTSVDSGMDFTICKTDSEFSDILDSIMIPFCPYGRY